MDWTNIRDRIRTLQEQAGLRDSDLASAIGYSRSMMSLVLNGKRGLGPGALTNIARFFDVPLATILQGPLSDEEPLLHFKNEDKAVFTPALYPRAKGYAFRFADTYRILFGDPQDLSSFRIKSSNPARRGEDSAEKMRVNLKISSGRIASVVDFIERLGIAVAEVDDDEGLLRGAAFRWEPGLALIVVQRNLRIESKRFLLAHELGHLVLEDLAGSIKRKQGKNKKDDVEDIFATDPHEQAANSFAARLLLPEADLEPFVRDQPELRSGNPVPIWREVIAHLSREYGVSTELVYWRLSQCGLFPQELARKHKKALHREFSKNDDLDPVFTDSEDMTRLTLRGIVPSPRYLQWVSVLEKRGSITHDEAHHLQGSRLEAA